MQFEGTFAQLVNCRKPSRVQLELSKCSLAQIVLSFLLCTLILIMYSLIVMFFANFANSNHLCAISSYICVNFRVAVPDSSAMGFICGQKILAVYACSNTETIHLNIILCIPVKPN